MLGTTSNPYAHRITTSREERLTRSVPAVSGHLLASRGAEFALSTHCLAETSADLGELDRVVVVCGGQDDCARELGRVLRLENAGTTTNESARKRESAAKYPIE